ncbi:ABC transporter ATP-binding protein [Alkaliphilus peptidifermentans]|uniref:ATP-binding cassette, subfamily B n=1 Tax=Alkaliphilus peptidifermentans DSM 18978 TaxID=1120976 RepID=A0A1G5CPN2_9FIRM|nr:ABC transporter ATP-binding protein [Alkaliphilus peptidifermentans]SCY04413.1 ATP-binding cassette, subfamily B [Alkaliphilus peptidifermentans DSM 18978]
MSHFKALKGFFFRNKWYYILGIIWLLLVDVLQLLIPEVLRRFTDQLQANTLSNEDIIRYGIYIISIGFGIAFFRFLWRIYIIGTSRKLEYELRNKLFGHLLKLSTNYYTNHKTGDLMAHATNDINAVRMALGPGIVMMTDAIFITLIAITMMATTTDWRLTILALLPLPFLAFTIGKFGKVINVRFKAVQESFSSLTDTVQENFSGIRVIKSFVQEDSEIKKFSVKNQHVYDKNMAMVKLFGMFFPFVQFMSALSFLIVVGYGGTLVIYGDISLGDFIAFEAYLALLVWPMMAIGWVINVLQRGSASMERINTILDEQPEVVDQPDAIDHKDIKGDIEFNNVSFKYPNSNEDALKNFTLSISSGTSIGVIGKTGSGKTTIATLLLRLFDANEGIISIDGNALNKVQLRSIRSQIGYVDQDSFLFSTTIAENIAFGVDECSKEEIIRTAKIAEVHDNIVGFPDGYETFVGERGVTLSGGQKQRISIARALIKKPKILVLDDALSAVDTDTEERILSSLKDAMKESTSIIIAHRISTIKDSDKIIVMDNGEIVEEGTHNELLENRKLYFEIYQKQLLEEKIAQD